ncbi:hypothetical protein, partial [Alienimonas sp. DA493]|uniref:hypothetical protein n=1 Tax=Alienimonas sp. DA493 TaxID=3373605 RepID=UPI003754ADA7
MLQPAHALPLFAPESVPGDRVVRAVLAATRLTPGDRALVHGPYAGTWEAVLEYLGVCVDRADTPAAARATLLRPGGAAYEAALYVGPAEGSDRAKAVDAADLVRPGRNSLAVVHGDDLSAVPPADALRLPDRGPTFLGGVCHPA